MRIATVRAQIDRRIGRRLTLFGRLSYEDQEDKGRISVASDFDDFRVTLGFRYDWEPINF